MFVICSNSDVENQVSKPAMIIGITGGIASGKSTLCKYLNEKYGVIHFDADKEIHALYEPGTEGYKQVVKSFGSEILNDDKSINRKILGEKVFGKPESMEVLRTAIGDIPTHFKNLLVNKKTVTQDTDDPLVQWVELELYNPYKDKKNNTIH